jgi:hypothetical protein
MLSGLEEYLAASARDRDSAEKDRQARAVDRETDRLAAVEDKRKQDADRATINRLTRAIMAAAFVSAVATVWGAIKPPAPIVIPAPIVYLATPDLRWSSCSVPSVAR